MTNRKKANIGLFKFPDTDGKPDLYKLWFNKIKAFHRPGMRDSFSITQHIFCFIDTLFREFNINITDINFSAGNHRKTLKLIDDIFPVKTGIPVFLVHPQILSGTFVADEDQKKLFSNVVKHTLLKNICLNLLNFVFIVLLVLSITREC